MKTFFENYEVNRYSLLLKIISYLNNKLFLFIVEKYFGSNFVCKCKAASMMQQTGKFKFG